jgi:hypothetical protein
LDAVHFRDKTISIYVGTMVWCSIGEDIAEVELTAMGLTGVYSCPGTSTIDLQMNKDPSCWVIV